MKLITTDFQFQTNGYTHIVDITPSIRTALSESALKEGHVLIAAIGSTTGITTIEFEPGLVLNDLNDMFEQFAPYSKNYHHNQTWGDDNGSAHLRSALTGTSMTVPFIGGSLILGTWQQVVFIDFDTRARSRKVVLQFMGL